MAWWMEVQPAWRRGDGRLPKPISTHDGEGWGVLERSGVNGLYGVMASLAWWGWAGGGDAWRLAMEDVSAALAHILDMHTSAKAAPAGGEKTSTAKRGKASAKTGSKRKAVEDVDGQQR